MEELDFNHLLKLINEAEIKLKEKIKQAHVLLKPYGVTYDALEKIVKSNLH
jgi:mevalonate kinase